jgi:Uma2 family endonuclease
MTVQSVRRRFTIDDYHKMIDAGILQEDDRVELLDGEIHNMSPVDAVHAAKVKRLNQLLLQWFGDRVIVSVQDPIQLNDYSEPQPDLAVLRWRDDFYEQHHPTPNDILLLIEVANTSASSDRTEKLPRYAAAGIPEVWIVNIKRRVIEQYTQPDGDEYVNRKMVRRGVVTTNCISPGLELSIDQIFGPQPL